MAAPYNASSLPADVTLSWANGGNALSPALIRLFVATREAYDWPKGTGNAVSQQRIIDLEAFVRTRLTALSLSSAHEIVKRVSLWAGNNARSHSQIIAYSKQHQDLLQGAIIDLMDPARVSVGINSLCTLPGINLVIASKVYRFCAPMTGAAIDRHASYFFNSLYDAGNAHCTSFLREWANGRHTSSRLAIYSTRGFSQNKDEYLNTYLPLIKHIALELNARSVRYRCAAIGNKKDWAPADVEMAAYYWWACNGER